MLPITLFEKIQNNDFFKPFFLEDRPSYADLSLFVEQDKQYLLKIDLPGFKKESIKVQIKNNTLQIDASRSADYDEKDQLYYCERELLKRSHCYQLPELIIIDKVSAKVENGVLEIVLPKNEEPVAKSKTITIN